MSRENIAYQNEVELVDSSRNDVYGAELTRQEFKVGPNFVPPAADLDYLTIEHELRKIKGKGDRYVVTRIDGWPTIIHQEEEPLTGKKVTVTRTFQGTEPNIGVNGTPRIVENVKQINKRLWMKVSREIDSTIIDDGGSPPVQTTFKEYHSIDYYFPSYLDKTQPFAVIALGSDAVITPNRSGDHQFKIPTRFEITYHTTTPNAAEVFQFKTVDIRLISPRFTLNEQNVLTDGGTITAQMYGNDVQGGVLVPVQASVQFTWAASSPTTTEYLALMGTEVLVADDSQRWKYNLWRRVKVYMTLPDLSLGLSGSLVY